MRRLSYIRPSKGASVIAVVLAVVLIAASAGAVYVWQQQRVDQLKRDNQAMEQQLQRSKDAQTNQADIPNSAYTSAKGVSVLVYAPPAHEGVGSPMYVVGQVPGGWSFEGQFPIQLKDASGAVLAKTTAKLQDDWKTDAMVPFFAKLEYESQSGKPATLVLQRDNPSGLVKNDDSVTIPITVK